MIILVFLLAFSASAAIDTRSTELHTTDVQTYTATQASQHSGSGAGEGWEERIQSGASEEKRTGPKNTDELLAMIQRAVADLRSQRKLEKRRRTLPEQVFLNRLPQDSPIRPENRQSRPPEEVLEILNRNNPVV